VTISLTLAFGVEGINLIEVSVTCPSFRVSSDMDVAHAGKRALLIAFYLANRDEVDRYLEPQAQLWDQVRQHAAQNPSPVTQQLRALSN
jgi:hypothetical protein